MGGIELLTRAKTAGLTVTTNGDKLIVRGPKAAEPLALELIACKRDVIAALGSVDGGEQPVQNTAGSIGVVDPSDPPYETIAPPTPCPRCGATAAWWNRDGRQRCLVCDPPLAALKVLDHARRIRRRLGLRNDRAEQVRHDLQGLLRV